MYIISEKIKDYIYINNRLLDNILSQIPNKNIFKLLKYKFGINIKIFEATIENELKIKNDIEKIKLINNYFEKNNLLKEPNDNLIYTPYDYYCIEKQYFYKVS